MATSADHPRGEGGSDDRGGAPAPGPEAEFRRHRAAAIDAELRRRLDEVFGDVMPRVTSDERDPGERSGMDVEFYRANRPPHHDR